MARITKKRSISPGGIHLPATGWIVVHPASHKTPKWINSHGGILLIEKEVTQKGTSIYKVIALGTPGNFGGSFGTSIWARENLEGLANTKEKALEKARDWMKDHMHWNAPWV